MGLHLMNAQTTPIWATAKSCMLLYLLHLLILDITFVVNRNRVKMNYFNLYNDVSWWDCITLVLSDL